MILAVPVLLTFAVGLACSFLSCGVPFAALGAFAAMFVSRRAAIAAIGVTWLFNQILGFTVHHYPKDPSTFAWGVGIGAAAFAAYALARMVRHNAIFAFLGAFIAYEAVLMLFSVRLGGWDAYTPSIILSICAVNAAWFAGMAAVTFYGLRLHPSR